MAWTTAVTRASGYGVTAAVWNSEHVDNMNYLKEVGYSQVTSDVTVTATSEATATAVVALGAITYEAVPHMIEFSAPDARPNTGAAGQNITFALFDSTTAVVGVWGRIATPAASGNLLPVRLGYRFTPTAASHTYNVKCWVSVTSGLVQAGAGGSATHGPAWLRIVRIPV
jgi:hypothetical protein